MDAGARRYRIAHYPVALIDRFTLADGRDVTLRPVLPQDAALLQEFVRRLSPETRYQRFHLGISELPAGLLREFTEVDYAAHVGLLAEVFSPEGEQRVVADARVVRRDDERVADLALVVADDFQGAGLGSRLMRQLLRGAAELGVDTIEADLLVGNDRMRELLLRCGFRVRSGVDDRRLLRASLALPQAPGDALRVAAGTPGIAAGPADIPGRQPADAPAAKRASRGPAPAATPA